MRTLLNINETGSRLYFMIPKKEKTLESMLCILFELLRLSLPDRYSMENFRFINFSLCLFEDLV